MPNLVAEHLTMLLAEFRMAVSLENDGLSESVKLCTISPYLGSPSQSFVGEVMAEQVKEVLEANERCLSMFASPESHVIHRDS